MASDDKVVGFGFRDTGGDRADARLGDELHRDARPRVRALEVVDELGESAITVGLRAWVATENYWPVKWKMNERIKEEFDAAGISIPYNQLDVHICPEPANKKAGKGDK